MSEGAEDVLDEVRKVISLVATARRLLASGAVVDLSALDDKVQRLCERAQALGREGGGAVVPALEDLIACLDDLAADLEAKRAGGG